MVVLAGYLEQGLMVRDTSKLRKNYLKSFRFKVQYTLYFYLFSFILLKVAIQISYFRGNCFTFRSIFIICKGCKNNHKILLETFYINLLFFIFCLSNN